LQLSALIMLLTAGARVAHAHPLHTTLAELSYDAKRQTINISLRVFADDFSAAVLGVPTHDGKVLPADSLMSRYVRERFRISSAAGRTVTLQWCGVRRAAEVLFLCLRASGADGLGGAKVLSTLLRERFEDQVNLVQANYNGRRQMLLFTKRDVARALPL
jgi:hypothetical protein